MSATPPELPDSAEDDWFEAEMIEPDELGVAELPARRPVVLYVALASSAVSIVALVFIAATVIRAPQARAGEPEQVAAAEPAPAPEAAPADIEITAAEVADAPVAAPPEPLPVLAVAEAKPDEPARKRRSTSTATQTRTAKKGAHTTRDPAPVARKARLKALAPTIQTRAKALTPSPPPSKAAAPRPRYGHFNR